MRRQIIGLLALLALMFWPLTPALAQNSAENPPEGEINPLFILGLAGLLIGLIALSSLLGPRAAPLAAENEDEPEEASSARPSARPARRRGKNPEEAPDDGLTEADRLFLKYDEAREPYDIELVDED